MQNVHTMQEPTKIKGKNLPTAGNSTSEIFEFDSEPVGADYRSALAADQRVAIEFLSITAQS